MLSAKEGSCKAVVSNCPRAGLQLLNQLWQPVRFIPLSHRAGLQLLKQLWQPVQFILLSQTDGS